MRKKKGINARAWFYSQSFHNSANDYPSPSAEARKRALREAFAKLEQQTPEQDFGGAFDGMRVISDADAGAVKNA